jgi:hypothetical protein
MRYFCVILLVAFISAVASAQVDTLQLVEIGSIQAPSAITELYVEDLDGDSLKEIIICTDYYVYIYNSQTYQVEWTSPPLNHPTDLLFEDINGDDLIDLSVKDNSNIHLFDPHTPQTIWTSPPLDTTFICYTVGDKNNDNWEDLGVVYLTETDTTVGFDTARIVLYNGPFFTSFEEFSLLMVHYDSSYGMIFWGEAEIPQKIKFYNITTQGQDLPYIVLIAVYSDYYYEPTVGGSGLSGIIYLINPFDLSYDSLEINGAILNEDLISVGDSSYIFLMDFSSSCGPNFASSSSYLRYLTADTLLSYLLWSRHIWTDPMVPPNYFGYAMGNIDNNNYGDEIAYAIRSYNEYTVDIYLKSLDDLELLWTMNFTLNCGPYILSMVKLNFIDFFPALVCCNIDCFNGYIFIEGATGDIRGYISNDIPVSLVADINLDGNDEILSIQTNFLNIYTLDYATSIGDDSRLPYSAFLRSNYPNPFNSSTTIEYGLPEAGRVRIDIYDLLGRKVETLMDGDMQAGRHRVVWDASGYSSGVYFYRIEAGDFADTKRMVYLK